jgi:hypothetical protein
VRALRVEQLVLDEDDRSVVVDHHPPQQLARVVPLGEGDDP